MVCRIVIENGIGIGVGIGIGIGILLIGKVREKDDKIWMRSCGWLGCWFVGSLMFGMCGCGCEDGWMDGCVGWVHEGASEEVEMYETDGCK